MRRCPTPREELSVHEAGHLVAIALTPGFEPGEFVWRRLPEYEIAHVEPIHSASFDWETPEGRNALIVRRVVVALAGGAATEVCGTRGGRPEQLDVQEIHARVGKVDFELAHEWLTLQRYDPDQRSLEVEIARLFREVCRVLGAPVQRAALDAVSRRILERLRAADATGADILTLPAGVLIAGLELGLSADFSLEATLFDRD
jgi:hypothetical protein